MEKMNDRDSESHRAHSRPCPPGTKTGDPISPPGGYIGGLQNAITDVAIDPAGSRVNGVLEGSSAVWVRNDLLGREFQVLEVKESKNVRE